MRMRVQQVVVVSSVLSFSIGPPGRPTKVEAAKFTSMNQSNDKNKREAGFTWKERTLS